MTEWLVILGTVATSAALRCFHFPSLRRLGAVVLLIASYLVGYFLTESVGGGFCGLLFWLAYPWIQLLTQARKLRLPVRNPWKKQSPPGYRRLPELQELTCDIEAEGFEYVADIGWERDGVYQFYRLFHNEEEKAEASIALHEQGGVALVSVALTSRLESGGIYRTTDLPYSAPMKPLPEVRTKQWTELDSFDELLGCHRAWIYEMGVWNSAMAERVPDRLMELLEEESGRQIRHNLRVGLVQKGETSEIVRYSWRGLFYLYFQLVKDMVRMC